MTAWWYWVVFVVAVLLLAAPVCSRLEARADRRDRDAWRRIPGSTR